MLVCTRDEFKLYLNALRVGITVLVCTRDEFKLYLNALRVFHNKHKFTMSSISYKVVEHCT